MTLTFSSSVPSTGAVDFYVNRSLTVTFNEALDPDYVSDGTILLYDLTSGANVPVDVQIKATDSSTIVVIPRANLRENCNFRLVVIGTDQGIGTPLAALNGDVLATSVQIVFATGDNVYSIDTAIQKEAAQVTLEGDLFLPTNIKAVGYDFTLAKIRPVNHSALTGSQTGIVFTFTKNLLTGQDLSTWVNVQVFPILQDTAYLCSGVTMDLGSNTVQIPSSSVSISGTELRVDFSQELPKNVAVVATLTTSIKSEDNDELGDGLNYSILTELYPSVYGPYVIKTDLNALDGKLNDDYVATLLFKNTIETWERLGRSLNLSSLGYAFKKYVKESTILDILEDQDYRKFLVAGTRRQLGDLNVSVDNMIGRLALKIASTQKEKDLAFESLVKGWQFKVSNYVSNSMFQGTRLWYDVNFRYRDPVWKYYQPNLPISNISINRQAKTTNPLW